MRPVKNPFVDLEGYSCFGCHPGNPLGLRMKFSVDGDEVVSVWEPQPLYAGFKGVLHGGIQATLHDEIASWVVFVILKTAGYTSSLDIRYLSPVMIDKGPLTLRSRFVSQEGNLATMKTTLYDGSGKACSESDAVYFVVPERIARRSFSYPGIEAFFEPADV